MAAQLIGGVAYLKIAGAQYSLKGKFEWSPQKFTREGVPGQDGPHGFTKKPKIPSMKATLSDLGGVSVSTLADLENITLITELANGKVVTLMDAWVKGDITVNSEEGTYDVEFEGMDFLEEVAA